MKKLGQKYKRNYSLVKHADFFLLDLICIQLSFLLACQVRQNAFMDFINKYFFMAGISVIAFLIIVMFWNIYSGILRRNFFDEFKNTFSVILGIFAALTVYCFVTKSSANYSRAILMIFFVSAFPITLISRLFLKEFVRKRVKESQGETLLFIREEDAGQRIDYFTSKVESGVIATGIVTYEKTDRKEIGGIPVVCSREELREYVETHDIYCVFMYLQDIAIHTYVDFLVRKKVIVYRVLRNLEKSSFRYSIQEMNGYKALCVRDQEIPLGQAILKRAGDIVGSIMGIIVTLPITLVTAILIKMEDGGPIFYVSTRVGQYGKALQMYKFRSMKLNADKIEDMLTTEELVQYQKEFKLENDSRVTKIGALIRKLSIDELPQLVNILRGDMSFIGPRPITEAELDFYSDKKDLLLSLKPGLTGYWQAYGRNNVTYESGQRQAMELYYIEHFSWWFDMKIALRTVKAVLTADGAQ